VALAEGLVLDPELEALVLFPVADGAEADAEEEAVPEVPAKPPQSAPNPVVSTGVDPQNFMANCKTFC